MAKKDKKTTDDMQNYYDLKIDKVDELVAALKGEDTAKYGEVSTNIEECTGVKSDGKKKEFDPYKTDLLSKIPVWLKALFIKWWFCGMVCYFIGMGLGLVITSTLDLVVVTGIVLGIAVEVLVNPVFKYLETDAREYDNYMMFPFPFNAYWTFFANIIYYALIACGVAGCYFVINEYMFSLTREPLLDGVFTLAIDMLFIGIKDLTVFLVKKYRRKEINNV